MDLGGITMRFEKWEEEAFNYLTALYENFFKVGTYPWINICLLLNLFLRY